MTMRTFKQNKLWRDKAVSLLEAKGSKIYWHRLDDEQYRAELKLKLLEEANEVCTAKSPAELTSEIADVMEVLHALCAAHNISLDEVAAMQEKKRTDRGGFDERIFVVTSAHPKGSFGEQLCLHDPEKYPEIVE